MTPGAAPPRGVFLDLDSLHPADLDLGHLLGTLPDWDLHDHTPPGLTLERLRGHQIVVSNKCRLDATTLAAAPELRLVCIAATGSNNVDLEAARKLGIRVCNVRGYATASVTEHWLALVLALSRRLSEHDQAARRDWPLATQFCLLDYPVRELAGRTLGLIGHGELGQAVGRLGEALGMQILVTRRPGSDDRRPGRIPLDDLLSRADLVSLHCPLTPTTRGLIGARELELMKPDALLINTARGELVDSTALASALRGGRIGGAALDVLEQEPPAADHPLLGLEPPKLILTPHVAWAAREARQRLVDAVADNIHAFLAGTPRNLL
ncbi:D-2-hydroxyacid dehydrogenase [Thiohalobacter sp. IOR34]|uniref:D-2-hydroxyacid dehydrogenase n=1 Tax=Thiohalobacter sp. IOR34 TaxID=3057176 RepID=UPI0025B122F6|nr:D-2-hydroxyacid dehydrogenase [Thiohalobacter sp. IOR34]WJW76015.1 D-2-hydroxyacid dehydrogenase [Thiohalobacter sp. IOR34]